MSNQRSRPERGPAQTPAAAAGAQRPALRQQRSEQRALYAWGCVREAADQGPRASARYGTLARKLPSYLQVSGVGQTLAFLFGRSGSDKLKPEALLLKHLGEHLKKDLQRPANEAPMETVLQMTPSQYRQATRELMELAGWLKRFAEGQLGQEED